MASAREIRNRIRSVKNIGQITRAQEAVSASKVRQAQARVLASRAFAEKAWEILLNVQSAGFERHAASPAADPARESQERDDHPDHVGSGLGGGVQHEHHPRCAAFQQRMKVPTRFVTIGRKGRDSLIRARAKRGRRIQ